MSDPVDPRLVEAWLTARSLSRGLPLPVCDHGGLRVNSSTADERVRHVFAHACDGLRRLGETIIEPAVAIKLCGTADTLRALLPPRWIVQPASWMMTAGPIAPAFAAPPGYRLLVERNGAAHRVRAMAVDGTVVAGGQAVEHGGVFVYDQIVTAAVHRRRGLGRAIMSALAATRVNPASRELLVATPDGAALYTSLGWTVVSPYSTALIPAAR